MTFRCSLLWPLPRDSFSYLKTFYELKRQVVCPSTHLRCWYRDKIDILIQKVERREWEAHSRPWSIAILESVAEPIFASSLIRTQYYNLGTQYFPRAFGFVLWALSSALWIILPFPKSSLDYSWISPCWLLLEVWRSKPVLPFVLHLSQFRFIQFLYKLVY